MNENTSSKFRIFGNLIVPENVALQMGNARFIQTTFYDICMFVVRINVSMAVYYEWSNHTLVAMVYDGNIITRYTCTRENIIDAVHEISPQNLGAVTDWIINIEDKYGEVI